MLPHLYALPYRSRLHDILREEQPDLIEVCDRNTRSAFYRVFFAGAGLQESLPPVVVGLSCERMDDNVAAFVSPGSFGNRWAVWYMRRDLRAPRFDGHISNSEYTARELWGPSVRLPGIPTIVCPMGVETRNLGPDRRSEKARRSLLRLSGQTAPTDTTRLLLYVGRISPEKNLPLLLDMMERLRLSSEPGYQLLVAGSGPLERWFAEASNARVPGCVHLLGQIANRERLAEIYANCDVLIHPNPREPFGIAPLEAMASGLPVVAPRFGGVLSYANEHNSWLAEPSGHCFADAVRQIFAKDDVKRAKIEAAQHTAEEFSWQRVTGRFFQLYDDFQFAELAGAHPPYSLEAAGPAQADLVIT